MSRTVSATRGGGRFFLTTLLLFLGIGLSPELGAAQTGTVTGVVTSTQNGQPLPAAQVYIRTLDIGALTQSNGRFTLQDVPAGTHTVSAERIGYRVATVDVTVTAGATVVRNFVLSEEALRLDEAVVTGTAGGSERRAVGHVVATVDVRQISAAGPVATVEDALIGRTPGVHLMP